MQSCAGLHEEASIAPHDLRSQTAPAWGGLTRFRRSLRQREADPAAAIQVLGRTRNLTQEARQLEEQLACRGIEPITRRRLPSNANPAPPLLPVRPPSDFSQYVHPATRSLRDGLKPHPFSKQPA